MISISSGQVRSTAIIFLPPMLVIFDKFVIT
nr:MAG TPA: hypothetical protein [Caudoviricetes sp.]